jgi:predicted nucleic acid-binding protein
VILVDSSVWIDHFRSSSRELSAVLQDMRVVCHPFVIGELACGYLPNRDVVFGLMSRLPLAVVASDSEARELVERHCLAGTGLGWVDVHLLASARLSRVGLWTRDKALQRAAARLGLE